MINANELRIGNWVTDQFYDSFKTMIQVDSQNDKGINLIIEDDGRYPEIASRWIEPEYKYEQLFGIPLTPEILEKCGFEKDYTGYRHTSQFSIYITKDGYFMPAWMDKAVWPYPLFDKKMEYLHQFQNLYHALTGEELPFQEK